MGLALVTRIPTLAEAHIAAGALRSAGIAAEVFDVSFGGIESPVIESLGGYRIMAPEAQAAEARELLKAFRAGAGLVEADAAGPWAAAPSVGLRERLARRRLQAAVAIAIAAAFWLILWLTR